MKKHKLDQDIPIGELKRINDFLPPPKELAISEQTVMVTLRLSEKSIDFFKELSLIHI